MASVEVLRDNEGRGTTEKEVLSTTDKFSELLKDFNSHVEAGRQLSARLKVLQKEMSKKGKRTPRTVDPDAPKKVSALQKPVCISDELCEFLGFEKNTEHSRQEVTTVINKFIKDKELQDPENRRYIKLEGSPDAESLKKLLRCPDQPVTFFNIQRYLKPHYPVSAKDKTESKTVVEPPPPVRQSAMTNSQKVVPDVALVEEAPKEVKPPPKRRVVRKATA